MGSPASTGVAGLNHFHKALCNRIGVRDRRRERNPMTATTKVKWSLEADYLQACNCDYGCPCEFSAPPTYGSCQGLGAWRINTGRFGDVSLDGLAMGFAAYWPKAIHEGNGTACMFFDEKANPAQRAALLRIASGQEGGMPFEIIVNTFSKFLDPQFVPFQFHLNGRNSSVKMGNAATITLEPIKNPVTREPESVRLEHATGFIFKDAEVVSGKECKVTAGVLDFSYPDRAGFVAKVKYAN
jgi:hypothetical protein